VNLCKFGLCLNLSVGWELEALRAWVELSLVELSQTCKAMNNGSYHDGHVEDLMRRAENIKPALETAFREPGSVEKCTDSVEQSSSEPWPEREVKHEPRVPVIEHMNDTRGARPTRDNESDRAHVLLSMVTKTAWLHHDAACGKTSDVHNCQVKFLVVQALFTVECVVDRGLTGAADHDDDADEVECSPVEHGVCTLARVKMVPAREEHLDDCGECMHV
jgi:hypothetical protein